MTRLLHYIAFITFLSCMGCGPGVNRISKLDIDERMEYHNVPGVSIAMINDFKIEWTKEYGIVENGSFDSVTSNTLFQSGSIGKSVMAAAALQLVEKGNLTLDDVVNHHLTSWRIPDNSFTNRTPVTLRQLLSHTAGVNLPGVIGYPTGDPLPDLNQILNGEPPANTPPIIVDQVPGTGFKYSGGGYMIVEKLLLDLNPPGLTFPDIIENAVFNPAGMSNSTFTFSPEKPAGGIASGHRADGKPVFGKWYRYPEMGMGVFWTTPTDMALFIIEIMNVYNGRVSEVIQNETAQMMLTPVVEGQGLGLRIGDDGKGLFYFSHRGAVEGYQTFIVGYPMQGQGAVIMTNSDNGYTLIMEILESISMEYRWLTGFYL